MIDDNHIERHHPVFDFRVPKGYLWLVKQGLIGYSGFGPLQPWYYLDATNYFSVSEKWPEGPCMGTIIAFARRQDNDDIACFQVTDGAATEILVIHGWSVNGYELIAKFSSFWEWLKFVIEDIAEWVENS